MFSIPSILRLLQAVGPLTAAMPEFKNVYDQIVGTFKKGADQDTLKRAYAEIQAANSGGHARLQEMLRKAEQAE